MLRCPAVRHPLTIRPERRRRRSRSRMGAAGDAATGRELMSAADVGRTISRIAHQIIEKTALDGADAPRVVLLGIPTRGVTLAERLAANIGEFSRRRGRPRRAGHHPVPRRSDDQAAPAAGGHLDPGRRDRRRAGDPRRRRAVLRTVGALGAGRAARRGPAAGGATWRFWSTAATASYRVRADYVGKNVPTSRTESVHV